MLVYSVLPLPESMMSFIWDFGSLSENDEKLYIEKLIEKSDKEITQRSFIKDELSYI